MSDLVRKYDDLKPKQESITKRNQSIYSELLMISNKINYIKEPNIDNDNLEERAKLMLGYKEKKEIVLNY